MPGKFVVKKGPTGKFRFSLVSTNGQVVVSSEAYETKRAAMGGVASVQKLAAGATIVDTTVAVAAPAKARPAAKKPVPVPLRRSLRRRSLRRRNRQRRSRRRWAGGGAESRTPAQARETG